MKVSVYGCGLTGLVTAWALADVGNEVVSVPFRFDAEKLRQGDTSFEEPGLSEKILTQLDTGRLQFADSPELAFGHGQVHFIALASDQMDIAEDILKSLAEYCTGPLTVINQSTFPVGTTGRLQDYMTSIQQGLGRSPDVHCLALPSFLQEGAAIASFTRPGRIIVGSDDSFGLRLLVELLRPFNRNRDQLMVMTTKAAEFTKYAINGMLATKLSFMNEMANLADQLEVDIEQVRQGVGSDPRIGYDYIYPGCGFGGLTFSEDIMQLAQTVEAKVEESHLLKTVLETNEQQKEVLFRKFWRYCNTDIRGKTVAIWGASFKPNTDSVENAPSLQMIETLLAQNVQLRIYDPKALGRLKEKLGDQEGLTYATSAYDAARDADALMILTEWKEFWSPDFDRLGQLMKNRLIFDGRNLFDPAYMKSMGYRYFGVGRSSEYQG